VVYVVGAALLTSAFLVSVFDFCIPSKIYNALFERKSGSPRREEQPTTVTSQN
jgi:hypothetical protein